MKNDIPSQLTLKEVGVLVFISGKIDFKTKLEYLKYHKHLIKASAALPFFYKNK
jgi:hypothetical protein